MIRVTLIYLLKTIYVKKQSLKKVTFAKPNHFFFQIDNLDISFYQETRDESIVVVAYVVGISTAPDLESVTDLEVETCGARYFISIMEIVIGVCVEQIITVVIYQHVTVN